MRNSSSGDDFSAVPTRSWILREVVGTEKINTVTFANTDGWGTVTENGNAIGSAIVRHGSTVTVNGAELTIGDSTFTATPAPAGEYEYTFESWNIENGATITDNTTITASYTREINILDANIASNNAAYGTVSVSTIENIPYGSPISVRGNELTVKGITVTATPSAETPAYEYVFKGWSVRHGTEVKNDMDIVATFEQIAKPYYVTWDPTEGKVNLKTTKVTADDPITTLPTPTRDHYTFDGWYTAATGGTRITVPYAPTQNTTLYAHWTPISYTVTFDAGEGTTPSTTRTGTYQSPITLPTATYSGHFFMGWYDSSTARGQLVGQPGSLYYPDADKTLYAKWSDSAVTTYTVTFNMNGGFGGPGTKSVIVDGASDEPYLMRVGTGEPDLYGKYFAGWATTANGEPDLSYKSDVEIQPNQTITLYAIWSDEKPFDPVDSIIGVIPIFVAVGILATIAGAVVMNRHGDLDATDFVKLVIGAAIAIVLLVFVLEPIIGGI